MVNKTKLDCTHFDLLTQEADRLLKQRNKSSKKIANGRTIQDQVIGLKNATTSVINDRLSALQQ